jgi:hypothetical protein
MRLTIFLAITTPQFLPFTFLLVPTDRSKFWRVACRRDRGRCRPIAPDSMGLPQLAPCEANRLHFLRNHTAERVWQHPCSRARPHSGFSTFHGGGSRHLFVSPPSCRVGLSAATVTIFPLLGSVGKPLTRDIRLPLGGSKWGHTIRQNGRAGNSALQVNY